MSSRLALYIGYNLGLIAVYLFIWKPLIARLNQDLWNTKALLRLMPLQIMAQIRDVRLYLNTIISYKNRKVNT